MCVCVYMCRYVHVCVWARNSFVLGVCVDKCVCKSTYLFNVVCVCVCVVCLCVCVVCMCVVCMCVCVLCVCVCVCCVCVYVCVCLCRYTHLIEESQLDSIPGMVYCPRPGCNKRTVSDPKESLAVCSSCSLPFCKLCRQVYHGMAPCPAPKPQKVMSLLCLPSCP